MADWCAADHVLQYYTSEPLNLELKSGCQAYSTEG
jgi:hypothetical protein